MSLLKSKEGQRQKVKLNMFDQTIGKAVSSVKTTVNSTSLV